MQRSDDREGERDRVHQIDVAAAVSRVIVRVAGDPGPAGHALVDHRVAEVLGFRAAVAASRRGGHDELRVREAEVLVVEAELDHGAGTHVVVDHVALAGEAQGEFAAFGLRQVQGQRPLVQVHRVERHAGVLADLLRRLLGAGPDHGAARQVEAPGSLDLDHFGAQGRQQDACVGAGPHPGELGDAYALERELARRGWSGRDRAGGDRSAVAGRGDFGENFARVFAELWRGARHLRPGGAHPVRPAGIALRPGARVVHFDEVVAGGVLLVVHHVRGVVDRSDRNAQLGGAVVEVVAFLFEGPGVDLGSDLHQVMAAVGHVLPFVALAPVRIAHQFAEELEVMIVEGVQDDVAVARLQPAHGRRAVRHP